MMIRTIIGGVAGGIAQFLVGFLFWGTPLSAIAFTSAGETESLAVRASLAQNLAASGTGTYLIPSPGSSQGTVLFGQGPIATVHFNVNGFPVVDTASLITGLIFSIVTALLIGFALYGVRDRVTAFADRLKIVILFAAAAAIYLDLAQPVFNHYGWGYFIYLALCDFLGLVAAGAVIARWFLPTTPTTA